MHTRIFISTLLLAILFSTVDSWAKPPKRKVGGSLLSKMSFGPQIGGSFGRISSSSSTYKEASFEKRGSVTSGGILWFTAGVTGEFYFLPQLGVAVELLYGRVGAYALPADKVKQESIIIPVLATYCTGKQGSGIKLSLGLQPSFALTTTYYTLTGGKDEALTEETIEGEDDVPNKLKLNPFDLALVGGLAYRFTNALEIGTRFSYGLLDRSSLEAEHDSEDAEKTNSYSINNQLYVGYNLGRFFK